MDIHVSNLSPETTQEDLRKAFTAHGAVASVTILTGQRKNGRRTGTSLGYGFVGMPDNAHGLAAVAALHQREIRGRAVEVREARAERITRHRR